MSQVFGPLPLAPEGTSASVQATLTTANSVTAVPGTISFSGGTPDTSAHDNLLDGSCPWGDSSRCHSPMSTPAGARISRR
jgi:hypothetical protein